MNEREVYTLRFEARLGSDSRRLVVPGGMRCWNRFRIDDHFTFYVSLDTARHSYVVVCPHIEQGRVGVYATA